MNWWRNRSIRFKASIGMGLILLPLLGGIIFGVTRYTQSELWRREVLAAENLNSITSAMISNAMMEGRKDKIDETLATLGKNTSGQFDSIAVYDDQSVLTSFATGFPGGHVIDKEIYEVNTSDPTCWVCHQLSPEERPIMTIITIQGQDVLRSVVPLYNEPRCQTCHGTGQKVLGDSIVDLSLDRFEQTSQIVMFSLGGSIIVAISILVLVLYQFTRRVIISPLENLLDVSQALTQGELDSKVVVHSEDEIGQLGKAFNDMASQIDETIRTLEQRVAERTQSLELRSSYLESSAEISRLLASELDRENLILQSVNLIRDRFDLYFVGLFLVDDNREWAVLKAGTGEAGKELLAEDYRLRIGEGMIGLCISDAQPHIASDISEDAALSENPFLPDTRSEGALPLRSRGVVLGAITVQSNQPAAFDQAIINTVQIMVDHIAISIENADLFTRSEMALDAERKAYGEMRLRNWRNLYQAQDLPKYVVSADGNLKSTLNKQTPETLQAIQTGQTVQSDDMTITLPIKIHGQIIGGIKIRKQANEDKWTKEHIELANAISEQMSIALENVRSLEDAQRRAAKEQLISEGTARVSSVVGIESILETTAEELERALGSSEVVIQLDNEQ